MLTLLALLPLAQGPNLTIRAGYTTLSELAQTLSRQHVAVKVSPDCAKDTYALRLANVGWDRLRAALASDGRLAITAVEDGWKISRSEGRHAEKEALRRYLDVYRQEVTLLYGPAARKCYELERLPESEAQSELDRIQKIGQGRTLEARVAHLVELCQSANEVPYCMLAFPNDMFGQWGAQAIGKVWLTNLWDSRALIGTDDSIRSLLRLVGEPTDTLTVQQIADSCRTLQVAGKICLDPVSLASVFRMAGYKPIVNPNATDNAPQYLRFMMSPEHMTPERVTPNVTPEKTWTASERAALALRIEASALPMADERLSSKYEMPERAVRVSEALLRCAESSGTNLVYYVSPFTDMPLERRATRSIAETIADANADRFDIPTVRLGLDERVPGANIEKYTPALHLAARLTVANAGEILVVRNEMRFLDGLCASPTSFPSAIENLKLKDQIPPLAEVAQAVAGMRAHSWSSSVFSSNLLDICNPASFAPIARCLVKSPRLLAEVQKATTGKSVIVDEAALEPGVRAELRAAVIDASVVSDAFVSSQVDSILASAVMRDSSARALQIEVTKKDPSSLSFRVLDRWTTVWSTWVLAR